MSQQSYVNNVSQDNDKFQSSPQNPKSSQTQLPTHNFVEMFDKSELIVKSGSNGNQSPQYAAYNIKNGLYIRPNSPTTNNINHQDSSKNLARQQPREYRSAINSIPISQNRLNNTMNSNILITEEDKNISDQGYYQLQSIREEDILEYRFKNFHIINPVPTEEDQDYYDNVHLSTQNPQIQNFNNQQQFEQQNQDQQQQRFAPPPTTNLFSPPQNLTPPSEQNVNLLPSAHSYSPQQLIQQSQSQQQQIIQQQHQPHRGIQVNQNFSQAQDQVQLLQQQQQQIQPNQSNQNFQNQNVGYNTAPLLSPNHSEDLWNASHNLTAATSNTVGSTAMDSFIINMTPSEFLSRHFIFQHEGGNGGNPQIILVQRPPPPSPLKTEENQLQHQNSQILDQSSSQVQNLNYINICSPNDRRLAVVNNNHMNSDVNLLQTSSSRVSQINNSPVHRNNNTNNQSLVSSVYQEVLENQQRSNQTAIKGLERVIEENEQLKQQLVKMELEIQKLHRENQQYQRVIAGHVQHCPNATIIQQQNN
eukprot:403334197